MDVRFVEHTEPNHIHVPRPSRATTSERMLPPEYTSLTDRDDRDELEAHLIACGDVSAAE
jgi:hypothetical protein